MTQFRVCIHIILVNMSLTLVDMRQTQIQCHFTIIIHRFPYSLVRIVNTIAFRCDCMEKVLPFWICFLLKNIFFELMFRFFFHSFDLKSIYATKQNPTF